MTSTPQKRPLEPNKDQEVNKADMTPYQRLAHDLSNDQRLMKEITLGKRIGFYRIRGELGSGNFSQVKMGIHALTKGKFEAYIDVFVEDCSIYVLMHWRYSNLVLSHQCVLLL